MEFLRSVITTINCYLARRIQPADTYRGHIVKAIGGSSIYRKLLHCFQPGDLLCGERAFCTYELMATMKMRQVDTLMRLPQTRRRVLNWRKAKKIGRNQRLVTWVKPVQQPAGSTMPEKEWQELPGEMTIRLIRYYYKDRTGQKIYMILASTRLDSETYDWEELADLYHQRWDIELRLRDVKTTLKMKHIRAKKPETVRKRLLMSLIAYNLIKASSQQAAQSVGEDLQLISFKGALDTIVSNTQRYLRRQKHPGMITRIGEITLEMISENFINLRLLRSEPRVQKKRPKPYSFLTAPRSTYKENDHRSASPSLA